MLIAASMVLIPGPQSLQEAPLAAFDSGMRGVRAPRVLELFNDIIEPFMGENDFLSIRVPERWDRCYRHSSTVDAHVCFDLTGPGPESLISEIEVTFSPDRGTRVRGTPLSLSCAINGVERYGEPYVGTYWHFDTEGQLVGAFEKMVDTLRDHVIPWMLGLAHTDIDLAERHRLQALKRSQAYTDNDETAIATINRQADDWETKRFDPQRWTPNAH
jgi:hypothetical protein